MRRQHDLRHGGLWRTDAFSTARSAKIPLPRSTAPRSPNTRVEYDVEAEGEESSQCALLVTPDGERTFAYIRGASWDLSPHDIDTEALAQADMLVSEIYMFEFGKNSDVAKLVFETVQQNGNKLVMKVMDQDFGKRYAQKIRALGDAKILDLLVGNHENLPSLTGGTLDQALKTFKDWKCDVLLTANTGGAYYISGGEVKHYETEAVKNPRNTAGAGDQFLAGFLMGRLDGKAPHECIDFAASCAKSILMHDTARPPLVNKHSIGFSPLRHFDRSKAKWKNLIWL
jgi:sugar/nucleoside kinase (ribokinase family)